MITFFKQEIKKKKLIYIGEKTDNFVNIIEN